MVGCCKPLNYNNAVSLQVELTGDRATCVCPHCVMNNGTPCMVEAARRSLAAQKPAVDHLQMSQLGMARRLLNPQLYELHDDLSESLWPTAKQTQSATDQETSVCDDDGLPISHGKDEAEMNDQLSDQEDIWADCAAELPDMSDDVKLQNGFSVTDTMENKDEDERETEAVVKMTTDEACQRPDSGREVSDRSETLPTNHEPATTAAAATSSNHSAPCSVGRVSDAVVVTTAMTTAPSTEVIKTSSTAACSTSAASCNKPERPRASPCRAALSKLHPPATTNGKDLKPPPPSCKVSSPSAGKQSSFSNAAAAKLLVDMVGRTKSAASGGGGVTAGQCKLTQCADKIHVDPVATDHSAGCTSRSTGTAPSGAGGTSSGTADGRKDGGKFCECWHCEFFGHMSVSCSD